MTTVVLVPGQRNSASPADLFEAFGSRSGRGDRDGGWLMGARCDAVVAGAPVAVDMPLGQPQGAAVTLLGRISAVVPGRRIEITHDLPWPGRITVRFRPHPAGGTDVSASAELDDDGLAWWLEQRGWRPVSAPAQAHRIGLLTSRTGPGAVFCAASERLARLAVEEVNADGGLDGLPVELVVRDDGTSPVRAAAQARLLVAEGCRAIVAGVTSASFAAVQGAVAATGLPVVHPVLNEGGDGRRNVFRWGERPLSQVRAAAAEMARAGVVGPWHLVGDDYSWSHGAHSATVRVLQERGERLVGHELTPLGTTDFSAILDRVERSGARAIVSSLVGADEVAFQRQLAGSGLRERCQVLSLVLDESTREHAGEAAAGVWTAFGYYQALDTPENARLLQAYRAAYGPWAPPLSTLAVSLYEAVVLYARAVRASRSAGTGEVVRQLHTVSSVLPRGRVSTEGPHTMHQRMAVAQVTSTGHALVSC